MCYVARAFKESAGMALPIAEIMIHQPAISGGIKGQATDIRIISDHIQHSKQRLNRIMAENTGKSEEEIAAGWWHAESYRAGCGRLAGCQHFSIRQKVAPPPSVSVTVRDPPWAWAISWAMHRPRPKWERSVWERWTR